MAASWIARSALGFLRFRAGFAFMDSARMIAFVIHCFWGKDLPCMKEVACVSSCTSLKLETRDNLGNLLSSGMSPFDGSCLGGIPGALILVIGLLDKENMFVTHDLGRVSASDIGSQRINPQLIPLS